MFVILQNSKYTEKTNIWTIWRISLSNQLGGVFGLKYNQKWIDGKLLGNRLLQDTAVYWLASFMDNTYEALLDFSVEFVFVAHESRPEAVV